MQSINKFFRKEGEARLDADFKALYQSPGATYLGISCALASLTFLGFYLLDVADGILPPFGGVQSFRLAVVACLLTVVLLAFLKRDWMTRNYTVIANIFFFGAMQAVCYVAYHARIHSSYIELYWGMTSSVCTGIVVIYGFSRLTARNTSALMALCSLSAVAYVVSLPEPHIPQLSRLIVHVFIVNLVAFSLRHAIESRERKLFVLAEENLRQNIYTAELEAAKAAAEEADAAKSRFLANMSHEVRTPMGAVLQILEAVAKTASPSDRDLMDKARKSGKALLRILNGILDYSQIDAGGGVIKTSQVSVQELVGTVTDLHCAAAVAKSLILNTRLDIVPGVERVIVDDVKVFEVLSNLVSNAVKFTDAGFVEITAQVRCDDQLAWPRAKLELSVRDTGIGIAEVEQEKVFLPFVQLDSGSNRKWGGTGLGLAIVKEMVSLMKGTIELRSAKGVGTIVRVVLPVDVIVTPAHFGHSKLIRQGGSEMEPSESAEVTHDASATAPFTGVRVLLIEDNELNAMLAARLLESLGLEVVVAENGLVGATEFERGGYEVVLMDCQMPVLDGYDATRRIRAFEQQAAGARPVPIIALTANTLAGDREKCLKAGMDDYLGKPYTEQQLARTLAQWLQHTDSPERSKPPARRADCRLVVSND